MLTGAAGELGPFPNPILTAADDGGAARGEAVAAVVASDGADLVALLWFAEGEGVADGGRGSALHCGVGGEGGRPGAAPNPSASPAAPTPAPGELRAVRTLFSLLWGGGGCVAYPAPFCRCRRGDNCRGHHSIVPRRATQ